MLPIVVIAESVGSKLTPSTLEICHVASMIADSLDQDWLILINDAAKNEAGFIAPRVISYALADGECHAPDMHASIAAEIVASSQLVMMAATSTGKDVLGRVAQLLSVSLVQDCTGFEMDGDRLLLKREMLGGKVLANVKINSCPQLVSFRPRSFPTTSPLRQVPVIESYTGKSFDLRTSVDLRKTTRSTRPDVTEASIVVSGGRGLQGPENWYLLENFLDVLGPDATLACSRPVSDEGWRPHHEHVGQTGRTIAPDVYIAVGISGATQHIAGIAGSKYILAINKDPDAPIFRIADYGIVGDLFEVVPALTNAIRGK
ncbi:MAG: electron transfer flavoprotein subunit alpha/FixB family protein [Bacteroidetes bacterium]|nr:electron transfer flavoprotein subunit alpha/FixB family protein [Bacteroidota bacterium]